MRAQSQRRRPVEKRGRKLLERLCREEQGACALRREGASPFTRESGGRGDRQRDSLKLAILPREDNSHCARQRPNPPAPRAGSTRFPDPPSGSVQVGEETCLSPRSCDTRHTRPGHDSTAREARRNPPCHLASKNPISP